MNCEAGKSLICYICYPIVLQKPEERWIRGNNYAFHSALQILAILLYSVVKVARLTLTVRKFYSEGGCEVIINQLSLLFAPYGSERLSCCAILLKKRGLILETNKKLKRHCLLQWEVWKRCKCSLSKFLPIMDMNAIAC